MKSVYIPAIVPYVVDPRPWNRPIHWLDPAVEEVYYPACLLSYEHWKKDEFKWNNHDQLVFGDSGGYSLVTRNAQIDPEKVIRWQLRVCTRGVMLDIPPYRSNTIQFAGTAQQYWSESILRTHNNVERALPYYRRAIEEGSEFRWWGVIQGETRAQMEQWHAAVCAHYSFEGEGEGWALAPKPSTDLLSITRYMKFAKDAGIKNIHLLQVTAPYCVGVVLALAVLGGFELVTYDSASAVRNAVNMGIMRLRNDGYDYEYVKQKGFEGVVSDIMAECSCISCQWLKEILPFDQAQKDKATQFKKAEWVHRLALHNHIIMNECFTRLHAAAVVDPMELLRRSAGKQFGPVFREWQGIEDSKPQYTTVGLFEHLSP